jgi:hypothetical protein
MLKLSSKIRNTANLKNMRIKLSFPSYQVEAELYDTPTARALLSELPIRCNVNKWGKEIYFGVNSRIELEEGAKPEVAPGDLAYWPNMPAFCIFYGPTPMSEGDRPVAASPVNVFGHLLETDPGNLDRVYDGENVVIEATG